MKTASHFPSKLKAVALLMLIILAILAANLSTRNNLDKLDDTVLSIYNDRLMPATFIFRLTDHLYQKQLVSGTADKNLTVNSMLVMDAEMLQLVKNYEATHLTVAEEKAWHAFKDHLQKYSAAYAGNQPGSIATHQQNISAKQHFDAAIHCLNTLSAIQATEGKNLSRNSRNMISDGVLMSHFEISVLLILGIFALVLLSAKESRELFEQQPLLN